MVRIYWTVVKFYPRFRTLFIEMNSTMQFFLNCSIAFRSTLRYSNVCRRLVEWRVRRENNFLAFRKWWEVKNLRWSSKRHSVKRLLLYRTFYCSCQNFIAEIWIFKCVFRESAQVSNIDDWRSAMNKFEMGILWWGNWKIEWSSEMAFQLFWM